MWTVLALCLFRLDVMTMRRVLNNMSNQQRLVLCAEKRAKCFCPTAVFHAVLKEERQRSHAVMAEMLAFYVSATGKVQEQMRQIQAVPANLEQQGVDYVASKATAGGKLLKNCCHFIWLMSPSPPTQMPSSRSTTCAISGACPQFLFRQPWL